MQTRKILFWVHLIAGCLAGLVILIMSLTGVALAWQRQIINWSNRQYRTTSPSPSSSRLSVEDLLSKMREQQERVPTAITLRADPASPAEAEFGREKTLMVNAYTGQVLGESAPKLRGFFRSVEDWHRWLAVSGPGRTTARAITGWCNLAFLVLVMSGIYLWLPRRWTWQHLRPVLWFRGGLSGRARDFNWHNTIGIWSALPLVIVVATGVVMSFPWANSLLYQMTGSEMPTQGQRPGGAGPGGPGGRTGESRGRGEFHTEGLNQVWARAEQQVPDWRALTMRITPSPNAPVTFAIDRGDGGRPDLRSQLTLNRRTGEVIRWEQFSSYNTGRRLRSWVRFSHTGEAGGVLGETVAAAASLGGAFLVWTGIVLALRRFRAWRARRVTVSVAAQHI